MALDRSDAPWPLDQTEQRELWRKRVKNEWLRLKLAGKSEALIRETLHKRYDNAQSRVVRYSAEDVLDLFLNACTTAIDPHSSYLSPRASEEFGISMRLALVGIGALLQERDEYATIRELTPGGPAARSGLLKSGDKIVAVGQGRDGPMVDVTGWRINDVVRLIRGEKDTVVSLDIVPVDAGPDSPHRLVRIQRDTISLEEQAAKKATHTLVVAGKSIRVGVITLPAFYQDYEGRQRGNDGFRSASKDVERLITELKRDGVDSLLMDLRDNGGGSLDEAIRITGMFIDTGPVVQRKDSRGRIRVESDKQAGSHWDGPLAVLINAGSASASEIFAAALQDYGRAVVIGETSFGKGTVQTIFDLDQITERNKRELGELKLTIEQFFRINGSTTQLKGVSPDISLPSLADPKHSGEASLDNALPADTIPAAEFQPLSRSGPLIARLQQRHSDRVATVPELQALAEDVNELRALRAKKTLSLNEQERRREQQAQEARRLKRHGAARSTNLVKDDGLQSGERDLSVDLAQEKARKEAPDVLLNEAINIAADQAELRTSSLH